MSYCTDVNPGKPNLPKPFRQRAKILKALLNGFLVTVMSLEALLLQPAQVATPCTQRVSILFPFSELTIKLPVEKKMSTCAVDFITLLAGSAQLQHCTVLVALN